MRAKKLITLIFAGVMLLALVIPAMAQDTTSPSEAAEETVAEVSPTPAPLTATTELFVTSPFRLNVRSGPGTQYTVLGVMTPVDSVDVTGQNEAGTWLRVNFNGQEGWVFGNLVDVTGDEESIPVAEPGESATLIANVVAVEEASVVDSSEVLVTTLYNTNLRSDFSTSADVLTVIPFDVQLAPLGRTEGSNWVQVTFDEQTGWVYAPILFFASGQVQTLPVLGTEADAAPAQTEDDTSMTDDTSSTDDAS